MKVSLATVLYLACCPAIHAADYSISATADASIYNPQGGGAVFSQIFDGANGLSPSGTLARIFETTVAPFRNDTNDEEMRGVIEFDLSSIPANEEIVSAELRVVIFPSRIEAFPRVDTIGFTGDGAITISDATESGITLGSEQYITEADLPPSFDITELDGSPWTLTLDATSLEALRLLSPQVTLRLQGTQDTDGGYFSSIDDDDPAGMAPVLFVETAPAIQIAPVSLGGGGNSKINLNSNGLIRLTIDSDANFDAETIDTESLLLGDANTIDTASASPFMAFGVDVDLDGDNEIFAFFRISDLAAAGAISATTSELTLRGTNAAGDFEATFAVEIK